MKRAAALVTAALGSEVVRALAGRYWREVLFVMAGPEGLVEGAIGLVIQDTTGTMTVADFKTDAVSGDLKPELEAAYAPQVQTYATVLRQVAPGEVFSKLVFLRLL